MEKLLKCHELSAEPCFACNKSGECQLLQSVNKIVDGTYVHLVGTRFDDGCPFYKTVHEAGGTYEQLCSYYRPV